VNVFGQKTAIVRISATALVTLALIFAVSHAALGFNPTPNTDVDFSISSTISSSPSAQVPALLYPGVPRYLWFNVHNPLQVPITVSSLGISDVTSPSGCPISNLDFSQTTFTGSLSVPALGTNSVAVPISLYDTSMNQNTCKGTTFNFSYSGSAVYAEVYATATAVVGSPSPSVEGQSVVYSATVTASAAAGQDPVPNSPTGSITFMDGTSAICNAVPLTSTGTATSTATCSPFAYSSTGTRSITAIFSNSDGNFTGSTSPIFYQVVDP
jgi:Bacterial Ig-like domain (group 3)